MTRRKNVKEFLKILILPVAFAIGTFLIEYIFISIYNSKNKVTVDIVKTLEYQTNLNNYINSKSLLITIITFLIFIPIFLKIYKKYKQKNNFKINNIILPIVLGITISLTYNIIVFSLNNIFHFTNAYDPSPLPYIVQILCSGIMGPILEELLFRGIVYNKLKKIFNPRNSIIVCSLIFSFMHSNIIDMIYAFIVSFILIYLYDKYKTIKAPILMHITLNITIILMLKLISYNFIVFNMYLLIVSILILVFIKMYLKNN